MTKPVKLKIKPVTPLQYVKLISGIFPGGLTKKEMEITALILHLQKHYDTDKVTQEMKEKIRLHLNISSQTMHNYWHTLKQKEVVQGSYKDFKLNSLFSNNVELNITYSA